MARPNKPWPVPVPIGSDQITLSCNNPPHSMPLSLEQTLSDIDNLDGKVDCRMPCGW